MSKPYGVDCLRLWWSQAGCSPEAVNWTEVREAGTSHWWNQQTVSTVKADMRLFYTYGLQSKTRKGIPYMVHCWGKKPLQPGNTHYKWYYYYINEYTRKTWI